MVVATIAIGIFLSLCTAILCIWLLGFGLWAALGMAFATGALAILGLSLRALHQATEETDAAKPSLSDRDGVSHKT